MKDEIKNTNKMKKFSLVCFIAFALIACKKKNEEPSSGKGLNIEFLSISPSAVKEHTDSITITFSYNDSDGDLGESNPAKTNLFVTDTRNNVEYQYRISPLAPSENNASIRGKLNVVVNNIAITDSSSSQKISYYLYVKDRSGNISNSITTSSVLIEK